MKRLRPASGADTPSWWEISVQIAVKEISMFNLRCMEVFGLFVADVQGLLSFTPRAPRGRRILGRDTIFRHFIVPQVWGWE